MSSFNDNSPFGDPFADPSITQVTNNTNTQSGLEDYNPFATQQTKTSTQVRGASNPPDTTVQITPPIETMKAQPLPTQQPPSQTTTAAQNITAADLQRRQEELERKAAELAAREEAIRNGTYNPRAPNWPPIPSICPFGPFVYQDINVEIPVEFQKIVTLGYYLWMYFVVVLIANFFAGLATWIHLGELGTFGFGFFGLVILTPLSFFCWFRPLYKAFRSDSSVNFMVFFFVFFCQLVLAIIWAIGLNGATGLITAIESIGKGFLYSFLIFSVATSTILYAVCSFLVLVKVHSIYRNTGASFAKAQAEFSQGVMSNETVRNAAAGAARQAMSSAFTGPNQSGNGAGGLRY